MAEPLPERRLEDPEFRPPRRERVVPACWNYMEAFALGTSFTVIFLVIPVTFIWFLCVAWDHTFGAGP